MRHGVGITPYAVVIFGGLGGEIQARSGGSVFKALVELVGLKARDDHRTVAVFRRVLGVLGGKAALVGILDDQARLGVGRENVGLDGEVTVFDRYDGFVLAGAGFVPLRRGQVALDIRAAVFQRDGIIDAGSAGFEDELHLVAVVITIAAAVIAPAQRAVLMSADREGAFMVPVINGELHAGGGVLVALYCEFNGVELMAGLEIDLIIINEVGIASQYIRRQRKLTVDERNQGRALVVIVGVDHVHALKRRLAELGIDRRLERGGVVAVEGRAGGVVGSVPVRIGELRISDCLDSL